MIRKLGDYIADKKHTTNQQAKKSIYLTICASLCKYKKSIYKIPYISGNIYMGLFANSCVNEKLEDEKLLKQLGERIRALRKKAGYSSQETFAYEAGIPRAQYGTYEKGVNITILNLKKIIAFHKLTFEEFFSEGFE